MNVANLRQRFKSKVIVTINIREVMRMHKSVRSGRDDLTVVFMCRETERDNSDIRIIFLKSYNNKKNPKKSLDEDMVHLPLREEVFKRGKGKKSDKGSNPKIPLDIFLFDFMISGIYPNKEVRLNGTGF